MIAVECRAWADNIQHDRMDRRGLAHFEVRERGDDSRISNPIFHVS